MSSYNSTASASQVEAIRSGSLFREACLIAGVWRSCGSTADFSAVIDPATDQEIGRVPNLGSTETGEAIAAAEAAFASWRSLLPQVRGDALRRWGELMVQNGEQLAALLTLEQGKPIKESRGEIAYAAGFLKWFGEEASRAYGDVIPSHLARSRLIVMREPIGVAAAITPWNFPSAMITRKAGAALAAGCPMIVKPSPETPFSAIALAVLAEQAGVPSGVLQVITGDAEAIGTTLCKSPIVRAISFTGSTQVGRLLQTASAATVKKVSLELGGHAPFIAFSEVDLEKAAADAVTAKFQTTGQDCLAANRLLVQTGIYEAFLAAFVAETRALEVGNGFNSNVSIGPLISEAAVDRCQRQVDDAVAKGARLLCGGKRHSTGRRFFSPTVLADVTPDMLIWREETFGPIAAFTRFDDESDAIRLANDTVYGLGAYIYSHDVARAWRVAEALESGLIGVNTPRFTGPPVPFGGVKQSGLGREGSRHGMDEYTELKTICFGGM